MSNNSDINIMENVNIENSVSSDTSGSINQAALNASDVATKIKLNPSSKISNGTKNNKTGMIHSIKNFCYDKKVYLIIGAIVIALLVYYFIFYKKKDNKKDDVVISLPNNNDNNNDNNIPLPPRPLQHMEISKEQYDAMIDQDNLNMPQIVHPGQNIPINDETDNADEITQSNEQQSLTAKELQNINDQLQKMQRAA